MSNRGHNAFYYFMLDFKEKNKRYKSLAEVAKAAGPFWAKLDKKQREVYENKAKAMRGKILNCDNIVVEEVEREDRMEMEMLQKMRDDIQSTLSVAKRSKTILSQVFYIIHMNSFCQHEHTKQYSPCEVAIAPFSLKDGVVNEQVYHAMIKPGKLPLGYASMAQLHSKETHQIEVEIGGEDNQNEIFLDILEYLTEAKRTSKSFPPLYAAERHIPMVKSVLKMWCDMFDVDVETFQIYNLQYMFKVLRNTVAGEDCWVSDTMAYQEINRDVYNHTPGIACEYHEMSDITTFCSRSIVIRYAYIICDNCCANAGIILIPGYHVPQNTNINQQTDFKVVTSKKSLKSKFTSESCSIRDDSTDTSTIISIGKSTGWKENSTVDFPELGASKRSFSSRGNDQSFSQSLNNSSANYASGSNMEQLSQDMKEEFPPLGGKGRGRGFNPLQYSKIRGNFKNS